MKKITLSFLLIVSGFISSCFAPMDELKTTEDVFTNQLPSFKCFYGKWAVNINFISRPRLNETEEALSKVAYLLFEEYNDAPARSILTLLDKDNNRLKYRYDYDNEYHELPQYTFQYVGISVSSTNDEYHGRAVVEDGKFNVRIEARTQDNGRGPILLAGGNDDDNYIYLHITCVPKYSGKGKYTYDIEHFSWDDESITWKEGAKDDDYGGIFTVTLKPVKGSSGVIFSTSDGDIIKQYN